MNKFEKEKVLNQGQKNPDVFLRGYCRVCNRHYFFRNKLDVDHVQFHQHHGGVCQKCNYTCARIKIPELRKRGKHDH